MKFDMSEVRDTLPIAETKDSPEIMFLEILERLGRPAFVFNTYTNEFITNSLIVNVIDPELLRSYLSDSVTDGCVIDFTTYNGFYRYTINIVEWEEGIYLGEIRQVDQLNKLVDELVHALRGPLSSIYAYSELILGVFSKLPDKVVEMLEEMINSARAMKRKLEIIECTITMSQDFETSRINLTETLYRTLKSYRVDFDISEDLYILANSKLFECAIDCLVSNAFDHAGDDIQVTVSVRMMGDSRCARISVCDNGCGLSEDELRRVLDPFTHLAETSHLFVSSLFRIKMFIEAMHGKIWAESEVGKGTKFHFTLPLLEEPQ